MRERELNEYINPYQNQPYGQPQQGGQPQNFPQPYQPSGQYQQPGQGWQYPPQQPPHYAQQQWQQPYPQPMQVAPRSPALGLIVSFFLPGVGSMMAGKTGKGIGILIGYFVGWLLCLVLVGFLVMPAFWIWGMVAAYLDAVAWNRAHGIIS